jgi:hypothetical protein
MAQALFIDLVREAQIEGGSESPIPPLSYRDSEISSIETQVTKIRAEEGRLVSIVLSDDQWKQTHVVKASSRRAVYDGIILYEPGWILIIENKPRSESIWPEQLNPSLAQDSQIEIDPVLVNLSWRSVIEHLSSLAERNLVVGAEKLILDDFFDFVDKHFTYLNPYDRFSKCKNEGYLLAKRCVQIMENLRLGEVKKHRGWKEHIQVDLPTVKMIALSPIMDGDVWRIVLEMYPGDTTVQARNFYSKLDINSFLALQEKGWTLAPNMHFSFITKILYHVQRSPILLPEYLKYWMSGDRPIQKVWRDTLGFEALFDSFLNDVISNTL